ncbi:MAG: DUF2970 domain-containing protein [Gammaproteobacteria bacterium]|nr:DUF2970 domain-containing protein [Gammaproteobacteria bacterium]
MCEYFYKGLHVEDRKPTLVDVLKSVLASFFGVQSDENRKRDFQHGNPAQFIIVGLVLTVLFIVGMILIVKLILASAT